MAHKQIQSAADPIFDPRLHVVVDQFEIRQIEIPFVLRVAAKWRVDQLLYGVEFRESQGDWGLDPGLRAESPRSADKVNDTLYDLLRFGVLARQIRYSAQPIPHRPDLQRVEQKDDSVRVGQIFDFG